MTLFETVYELICEDDHEALRRTLNDHCAAAAAGATQDEVEDGCHPAGTGDDALAPRDSASEDMFLVCRMNAASSTRRISSVSNKPYRLKVCGVHL